MKKRRTVVYVDGFNLYHAIDDLKQPHLKWVDLWALGRLLLKADQQLIAVKYYSALAKFRPVDRWQRHQAYVKALEAKGVTTIMSKFKTRRIQCRKCGTEWKSHEEKETDVFLAADIVEDLYTDRFDVAILITADSDIRPAVDKVRNTPGKLMLVAAPPRRFGHARSLNPSFALTRGKIARCLLEADVAAADGGIAARRPAPYTPPPQTRRPQR